LQHYFSKLRFVFYRPTYNILSILSFIRFLDFVFVKVTVEKIRSTPAFQIDNVKQDSAHTATLLKVLFTAPFLHFLTPIQYSGMSGGIGIVNCLQIPGLLNQQNSFLHCSSISCVCLSV